MTRDERKELRETISGIRGGVAEIDRLLLERQDEIFALLQLAAEESASAAILQTDAVLLIECARHVWIVNRLRRMEERYRRESLHELN